MIATAAIAHAEVGCRVADYNLTLDLLLPTANDGSGSASGPMQGTLQINHQRVPKERRQWSLENRAPAQFWNTGGDLKLRIMFGAGDSVVDLVIDTQQQRGATDARRTGTFRLETGEGVRVIGRIECSAD